MNRNSRLLLSLCLLIAVVLSAGCVRQWEFTLNGPEGEVYTLDNQTWDSYSRFRTEFADEVISLEQILYGFGFRVIDRAVLTDQQGTIIKFDWSEVAESAWLRNDGLVLINGIEYQPLSLTIEPSPWVPQVEGCICDIAPTVAAALGIRPPELTEGRVLTSKSADHVLMLFLDAFGYIRYQESLAAGLIPVMGALDPPLLGLTTYPPITTVSTASLLTGAEPPVHGVETRGIRITDHQTLFENAEAASLRVVAIEGEALAFNLKGSEMKLSGDRDGNGGTDDNVLLNALAVLDEGMPDLFFVHFHGIDDLGHKLGPGAPGEEEKIREVDLAVGQILERLPTGTLIIIFADHGMHKVAEEGRIGNHGHLIPRDMLIPIWITIKE
jgi:hypothetical protein